MLGNNDPTNSGDDGGPTKHQLSIEKACEEYNNSVKLSLDFVNRALDDVLLKNCNSLDELAIKIAARMNFLQKNPTFLTGLVYEQGCVKCEPLLEFDDIRITLKEHSRRFYEKIDEIQKYHERVLELVRANGRDKEIRGEGSHKTNNQKESDEEFQDCLDKDVIIKEECVELPKKSTEPVVEALHSTVKDNSFHRVSIQKDAYSDQSLGGEPVSTPVKFQVFPDIIPEVYRRKPTEDLHAKLLHHLVTNDSLEHFLHAMDHKTNAKIKKTTPLEQKYTGSLWFFPKEHAQPTKKGAPTRKKSSNRTSSSTVSTCLTLSMTSSQASSITNTDRSERVKQSINHKLKYYDLLDDVDQNDVIPIKSEYPRRDNMHSKQLKGTKSYLQQMMQQNDKVWKKLLQPIEKKKKKQLKAEAKNSQVRSTKSQQMKNLMEYLTSPEQKILTHVPHSLIVMPVRVSYDNLPTKDTDAVEELTKALEPKKTEKKKLETNARSGGKNVSFPVQRRQEMLDQLIGLKTKNDNIQKNIQKAIDVIEAKMIDLLSSQTNISSTDAFNAMEKEITTVLQMMTDQKEETAKEEEREAREVKMPQYVGPATKEENGVKTENVKEVKREVKTGKHVTIKIKSLPSSPKPSSPKMKRAVKKSPNNAVKWEGGDCREGIKRNENEKISTLKKEDNETHYTVMENKAVKAKQNRVDNEKDSTESRVIKDRQKKEDGDNGATKAAIKDKQKKDDDEKDSTKMGTENKVIKEKQKKDDGGKDKPQNDGEQSKQKKDDGDQGKQKKDDGDQGKQKKDDSEQVKQKKDDGEKDPKKTVTGTKSMKESKQDKTAKKGDSGAKPMKDSKSNNENWRKTANIEEGERLLGQVDSVIRKIDSIYNRFYDDKSKVLIKPEANFSNIADFFGVMQEKHEIPLLVDYPLCEYIPEVYHETSISHQMSLEYTSQLKQVPKCEELIQGSIVPVVGDTILPVDNKRHAYTLKAFYTLFFSGVFMALNFDYAV